MQIDLAKGLSALIIEPCLAIKRWPNRRSPMTQTLARIPSSVVPDELRFNVLPRYLGRHFLQGEALVYDWAGRLCHTYDGGFWNFFTLSNGGFYMAPANLGRVHVRCHLNGYNDSVVAHAFCIVVTLFALLHLAEKTHDDT